MMHRLGVLLLFVTVFITVPVFSQSPGASQDTPEDPGLFPLLLLTLADGGGAAWDPSWPADFPPDSFSLKKADARSIELVLESTADDSSLSALIRWDDHGRLLAFPFAQSGEFAQVTVRRSSTGRVNGVSVGASSIAFKFAEADRLESALMEGEAGPTYAAFTFRDAGLSAGRSEGSVIETRMGEDGLVTAVLDYAFIGNRLASLGNRTEAGEGVPLWDFDHDSAGHVVAVTGPDFHGEALYGRDGRVVYWRTGGSATGEPAGSPAGSPTDSPTLSPAGESADGMTERRFQWDERGFLVRELVSADDVRFELRYTYVTDARGNWVERRTTRWTERFGSLVSEEGPSTKRIIRYR